MKRVRQGRRRHGGERGNAMVEFTWLAVLLMVPLVYLVLTVFEVQRAAYAMEAASREAGRAFVTSDEGEDPRARAVAAARLAAGDQNVALSAGQVRVSCRQHPCLTPGSSVRVRVRTQVALPYLPKILFGRAPATIGVRAEHVEVVDIHRDASAGSDRP